uniref:Reverse transcriptase domain-containing protein n=1 Tax=Cannabis sativa TaxID=3483 RepID=A0A803PPM0_CANSA
MIIYVNQYNSEIGLKAFFSIPNSKSPGSDGFNSGFFKVTWADIGKDICKANSDFFVTSNMPSELHSSMISLIPKHDHPTKAIDYRPIACFSTLYKCVSKLLCSRLAKVLPLLTNQNQGAFVQGESIAHNVMILQDLLKNYNRKNISPWCAIKIDISKAYDTVNWDFLEDLLATYNLPQGFIKWLMTCITSTSNSIVMNGRIQGSFKGEKGLRQGDPLSPLLFVLVMEYLTRLLQLAANNFSQRFHPLCKKLKLINLCFVDDLIIFSKGSHQSITVLKQVLRGVQ